MFTKVVSHVLRSLSEALAILYLEVYNVQQNHVIIIIKVFQSNNLSYRYIIWAQ